MVQSTELDLIVDVTASLRQQWCMGTPTISRETRLTLILKDEKLAECPVMYSDVPTLKHSIK